MEVAYRIELIKGCPEAAKDKHFYEAIVQACAFWSIKMTWASLSYLLQKDKNWGIATLRQRVLLRFHIIISLTKRFSHLEALGSTFYDMERKLLTLWPDETHTIPYYPAFR